MTGRPAHTRELGVVFQSLALFPHLQRRRQRRISAADAPGRPQGDRPTGSANALDLVQLPDLQHRAVSELSGGQSQRVALARALVYQPRILLLDEPLSALDRRLRETMQLELTRIHRELGVTIVNVTHDQREALMVSDRIAVMDGGRIVQCGPGTDLYANPATAFVAGFLGDPLLLEGDVVATNGGRTLRSSGVGVDRAAVGAAGQGRRRHAARTAAPARRRRTPAVLRQRAARQGAVLRVRRPRHVLSGASSTAVPPRPCTFRPARSVAPHDVGDRVVVAWNADDVPIVTQA